MEGVKIGKYRHFKGDIVQVVGTAFHSETLEEFVMYKHVTGAKTHESHYWVRPKHMFLENIEKNGTIVKRFEYIGN